jgi:hypothetical protein
MSGRDLLARAFYICCVTVVYLALKTAPAQLSQGPGRIYLSGFLFLRRLCLYIALIFEH